MTDNEGHVESAPQDSRVIGPPVGFWIALLVFGTCYALITIGVFYFV